MSIKAIILQISILAITIATAAPPPLNQLLQDDSPSCEYAICKDLQAKFTRDIAIPKTLQTLERRSRQGDGPSQILLGYCYQNGIGVTQNLKEAVYWYQQAIDINETQASLHLGLCHERGLGVPKDYDRARLLFQRATDKGIADAQFALARCYFLGRGTTQDPQKGFAHCHAAAQKGSPTATFFMGYFYILGQFTARDPIKAFKMFHEAAEQGHTHAQYATGLCYAQGQGCQQSKEQASAWMLKSAEKGYTPAQAWYGIYCIEQDRNIDAVSWLKLAAHKKDPDAQLAYAFCFLQARGVDRDTYTALKWCRTAAKNGNKRAKSMLPYFASHYKQSLR